MFLLCLVHFEPSSRIVYHRQASSGGVYRSLRLTVIIYRYIPFIIIGLIGFCVGNDKVFTDRLNVNIISQSPSEVIEDSERAFGTPMNDQNSIAFCSSGFLP